MIRREMAEIGVVKRPNRSSISALAALLPVIGKVDLNCPVC
jgi:hypothetical protein